MGGREPLYYTGSRPPVRRVGDDNYTSNEIHAHGRARGGLRVWSGGTHSTNSVPQTNPTPQSISPGEKLADASKEDEWRQVGRVNQGGYRFQRQHLGLSSMFQHRTRRRRNLRRPL